MRNVQKSSTKREERLRELVGLINKYNHEYYVMDAPSVSDDEWDALYKELQELERETGIILPDSPTQKVGGAVKKGFRKHKHLFPLLSLDKAQSVDEVRKWFDGIKSEFPDAEFCATYKFDGIRLVLTYDKGTLVKAATRGDGKVGEDVTEQAKTITSIPKELGKWKASVEIGGEVMMSKANLPEGFKNTRNAAAGAVRNIDPSVTARQKLDFFAYELNFIDGMEMKYVLAMKVLERDYGFRTMLPRNWKGIKTFEELERVLVEITAERDTFDYDIDGVVISLDEPIYRAELGTTIKFPRWAMAYKFEAEVVTTKLLNIVWQVGRSGKVTPVAILEPVELCGATVTRATLNNYGDMARKGVRVGGDVVVRRSNDVIPEVLGIVPEIPRDARNDIVDINECPSCGTGLEVVGANKFCKNQNCGARVLEKFSHFVSRDCMNIEGLSDKTLEVLISKGFIKRLGDIYRITASELMGLEGFKDKKINNLLDSIEKSKNVDFARFINALGIPNVGKKASATLASNFASMEEIRQKMAKQLIELDEFGEVMAQSVVEFFKVNREEVDDLVQFLELEHKKREGVLLGLKVCVTGTLAGYTRSQLAKALEELGASVVDGVSKTTDVLIVGEGAGSKLEKARKFGVRIVEESGLVGFLGGVSK